MLTGLSIGNFKAFGKTQRVPLKPITLVFGPNSSGKSSLIHALALAHEIFKRGRVDINRIESNGGSVDLGGFAKYVYKRDLDSRSTFSFEFKSQYAQPEEGPYCMSLAIGLTDEPERKLAVLQYLATTKEGKLFELANQQWNGKTALALRDVNMEHPKVKEIVSKLLGDLATVESTDFETNTMIRSVVEYAASLLAFQTTFFLRALNDDSRLGYAFNIPIPLYLLTATSSRCYSWLLNLALKTAAWEDGRSERDEERRRRRAETPRPFSDNPEAASAFQQLLDSVEAMEEIRPPLNDFHSAISFVLADGDEQESLYMPRFDMSDEETGAFYSAVDPYELEQTYEDSGSTFGKLIDALRAMVFEVNDVLAADYFAGIPEFTYLGPVRTHPARTVQQHEATNGSRGESFWDYLAVGRMEQVNKWLGSDFLNTHYRIDKRELFTLHRADLTRVLESAKLSDGLNAVEASLESSATELVLTDLRNGTEVDLGAVGFGIGQVLPVLLSCFETSEKFIAIEQPEIHLHPALQAELGDVFIDSAKSSENRFVLETHSEHLILRLLRRIRETTGGELADERFALTPEEVAVLYVQPGENGAEIVELRIDEEGEFIDRWPDGFFAERAKELF